MGMFDTVKFRCDNCGHINSVQSKAGKCDLAQYNIYDAPLSILGDLQSRGGLVCSSCGMVNIVIVSYSVEVRCDYTDKDEEDDDDLYL